MMLDHYAYRVKDREKAIEFLEKFLGYHRVEDFEITLSDGSTVKSSALQKNGEPDVFVSSGEPGSLVSDWVESKGGVGAIHHMAYAVESVEDTMDSWQNDFGFEFTRKTPIVGVYLTQAFTKPNPVTGIIYELIEREDGKLGFEPENVKKLMESTREL